ncbi:MAG: DUF6364 family protein [Balneolaceae bacterium]|nr:DUF6364 family protein [Balneolaceae bacterium]
MKKKLTLTIQEDIIKSAKRQAERKGISLSQMVEEIFEKEDVNDIKTESQKAAERLLKKLEKSKNTTTKRDKELIKEHVKRKFT